MLDWFTEVTRGFQGSPWLQGLSAAFCTFILEDPTTVGSGLLVADGKMAYTAALFGLFLGIALGDLGLYFLGRFARGRVKVERIVGDNRLARAETWLCKNAIGAVLAARFLPGMRTPTYLASGLLRVNPWKFMAVAVVGSLAWTLLLLNLTIRLGERVMEQGLWIKLPIGVGIVAAVAVAQWRISRRIRAQAVPPCDIDKKDPPVRSYFEFWPPVIFYAPVFLYCLFQAIKHRGLMLFTLSNPLIYSGGMLMESKSDVLFMVPSKIQQYVAPHVSFTIPYTVADREKLLNQALNKLHQADLDLPIVAKPDVGQRGYGVRPIFDQDQLARYLMDSPPGFKMVLQELVDYPDEAGVLYYRRPGEPRGHIISITLKYFPKVVGDGRRTLGQLIMDHPRAQVTGKVFLRRHRKRLDEVIPKDEVFKLVFAGDHSQGTVFLNGTNQVTEALLDKIDHIAKALPEFYFGRFDIRCQTWADLQHGRNFRIVEINGAGGEPTHIWDPSSRLTDAYRALFQQYRLIYEIGAQNGRRGFRAMSARDLIKDFLEYRRRVRFYPLAY